jgi:hypothetical protein
MQWTPRRQDFLSRSLMDFAKAMFAVGFASYFFKEFPIPLRIGCAVGFFALFVGALLLYPARKPED